MVFDKVITVGEFKELIDADELIEILESFNLIESEDTH